MTPDWRPRSTGADPWAASVGAGVLGGAAGGVSVGAQGGLVVAGLEWMQARVYDPGSRSFLSTDPLDGVAGAAWSGNPYSFAGNDPLNFSDPLGLRPVSDAELQSYRDANRGMLSNVYHAATNWVKHNWEYIAAGAMIVGGVAAMVALGPIAGGIVGGALLSAGMSTAQQKYSGKGVNWKRVGIDGAVGGVTGMFGGAAAKGVEGLMSEGVSCVGRNIATGIADGTASGGGQGAADYLRGNGPKSFSGFAGATLRGARNGAVTAGVLSGVMSKACFVADTQVLMGDGSSKAIQDVQVGDEVLAWNPATDQNEPRKVVETFVHEDVETWEVETSDGQVITSTADHPFWVEGKGWTPVRGLTAGDVFASADGSVDLVRVEATGETARVFNVHVEGLHNYHVGDGFALRVHNTCIDPDTAALIGHTQREIQDFDKGLIPMSYKEIANLSNPRIAAATRGTAIDRQVKAYVASDPNLQHLSLTDAGFYGPDLIDFNTGRWWDLTTAKAWAAHVRKYAAFGPGIGLLH